jgi:tight adherence protein B
MVTLVLAALAIAAGIPGPLVALGWVAAAHPGLAFAGFGGYAGLVWWRQRRRRADPDDEAAFLLALSAELTAGASLRSALVAAADRSPRLPLHGAARAAAAGLPAPAVAQALGAGLPVHGRMTAAAWMLAAESGGPAAAVMQSLAVRATREGELIRERRALTAQARASAWVVAGLPVVLLLGAVASGRLDATGDPALGFVVALGVALQAAGVAVVVVMVRRSER